MNKFDNMSSWDKLFMKAWNRFIHLDVVVPDSLL